MKPLLAITTLSARRILLIVMLLTSSALTFALDLAAAKSQGLVGEGRNGFVGFVVKPPSPPVKALVADINAKRKAIFEKTAKKNNISITQVAGRFYERALQATKSGHYYQNAGGTWVKK